jgi:hypothetical protein
MNDLAQERIKECLTYVPATGKFYWRMSRGAARRGAVAGAVDAYGYVNVRIDGKLYKAHRLAWLYEHGVWPGGVIDHINNNPSDNRLVNLRDVSQSVNMHNAKVRTGSRSGVAGVRWRADRGCWIATIRVGYAQHYLGSFASVDDAIAARKMSEQQMLAVIGK